MATKIMDRWLKELQQGTFMLSDIQRMGKLQIEDVLEQIAPTFSHKFLKRSLANYQEVGLAESYRAVRVGQRKTEKDKEVTRTYHHCLFLTSDSGMLTGLTIMTKLRFRPSPANTGAFELLSGSGVSIFRDIDGRKLKVLDEKTGLLTKDVLKKRGWLFGSA